MPIIQEIVDFNQMFHRLSEPPIVINDLTNNSEEDKEMIRELVTSRYSSDMIALLPTCRCGVTKGEFTKKIVCNFCGTLVKSSIEDQIEPTVWFRRPNGVERLISPIFLIMLKQRFKKSGYSIIQWLIDRNYRPSVKQPHVINKLVETGIQRGYNYFVQNFDAIMALLFSMRDFKKRGKDYLRALILKKRHHVFSDYIPIPNKSILIVEKTKVGVYVDPIIVDAVNVIEMLVSIDKNFYDQNPKTKENRTARALVGLADFYEKYYKANLAPKPGQFRRHIFGARTNFSFRAVITSLTDTHDYRHIEAPWGVGLTAFKYHLCNKLMRLGMDNNSAIGLLLGHVNKYHPLLDKLLKELVLEAGGAVPVILGRNPSLLQGSVLRLGIGKFKTDPNDLTIGLSILVVRSLNADFDGKALPSLNSFNCWKPLRAL